MSIKDSQIYSVELWAQLVKKKSGYECAQCSSGDDVQATYIRPPSLGGRNTLDNGIALCVICRSKPVLHSERVRFNFSIPKDLNDKLNEYCSCSGRSINDVIKQLLADFIYDSSVHLNGFHTDANKNTERRSIPVLRDIHKKFLARCSEVKRTPGDVIKSMIYKYLKGFQGDIR